MDSPNETHYDNVPESTTYRIQITMYSKKPSIVQASDAGIKAALYLGGFQRVSGRALPFNKETGHYAWATDYKFYEYEMEE